MIVPFVDIQEQIQSNRSETMAAVGRVLDSAHLIMGGELSEFEDKFAKFCAVEHAIGVGNGLDALSLVLRAWNIGPGDEVIVPSQTFVATWLAVSHVGATPVPVDISLDTHLIDPALIRSAITSRTKAILPVHLYGHLADMAVISSIASEYGLYVLEDAAQAHGAELNGVKAGSYGTAAAFSFYPTKNLGAYGDGGAIVTNDGALAAKLRRLRNYGSEQKYVHTEVGYNSRLDELQAAILQVQLKNLSENNAKRINAAKYYSGRLSNIQQLILPVTSTGATHVYHLYVVRHAKRDLLLAKLNDRGVHCAIHYPIAPGDQQAYRELGTSLPNARLAADTCLSLPLWPDITREQQDYVVDQISGALREVD